jgi:hypothetical protein
VPRSFTIFLTTILMASTAGCGNSKDPAEKPPGHIQEAQERFGERFECEPNGPGDYVLCAHRPDTTAMNPLPQVTFFVFDLKADEVVLDQAQTTGSVRWTADYDLEMTLTAGIVTNDGRGAPTYRIDVRSGDRQRLDDTNRIPK